MNWQWPHIGDIASPDGFLATHRSNKENSRSRRPDSLRLTLLSLLGWAALFTAQAPPANAQVSSVTSLALTTQQSFIAAILQDIQIAQVQQQGIQIAQAQQGEQVLVNGSRRSIPWAMRNDRVGVADIALWQELGVELLSTSDPSLQPVQWFSDPTAQPIVLNAWNDGQFRYVDLGPLATAMGWRLDRSGSTLQITTPSAQILGLRHGRQVWGDRFVIDLNQATTWQLEEQANGFTLTLDGVPAGTLTAAIPTTGNAFQSSQVQSQGNRIQLQVQSSSGFRPVPFTLPNPNRLVIDLRADASPTRNIQWAPGLRWRQQTIALGSSAFPVTWLEVEPRQSGVSLRPFWGNGSQIPGTAPLVTTARQWQAAAAINAGFFNRNNQLPLGAIRRENRWFSSPILNRGAIAWNDQGAVQMERLTLRETLTTNAGDTIPLFSLNSGYVAAGISRYTREWGDRYTSILDQETVFTVRQNQVIDSTLVATAGQGAIPIPQDGYLLVARGGTDAANRLRTGTTLQTQQSPIPSNFEPFPNIVGAGPLLVSNRQVVLNATAEQFSEAFAQQQAARSAIGYTANGTILMVAIQTRINGRGPSLREMAQLMQLLGATDALNLDGGSSASLYLGGRLINRSPSTAARVHNNIGVFLSPTP